MNGRYIVVPLSRMVRGTTQRRMADKFGEQMSFAFDACRKMFKSSDGWCAKEDGAEAKLFREWLDAYKGKPDYCINFLILKNK